MATADDSAESKSAITGHALTKALQEYTELGHEYRYRDTMMVQEFYLSMVVIGISLTGIFNFKESPIVRDVIVVFGLLVLVILALHLRNTNQDRVNALKAKAAVGAALGFVNPHLNVSGLNRTSVPRLMLAFTAVAALCWFAAAVVVIAADVGLMRWP